MSARHRPVAEQAGPRGGAAPDGHDVGADGMGVRGGTRLRDDVARQLEQAVPHGWAVSTGLLWSPARSGGLVLRPHVAVHRPLTPDGGLPEPPTLCVDITRGRSEVRSSRPYARCGVDHYWHLDTRSALLEVFVRVEEDYRHAESMTLGVRDRAAAGPCGTTGWVDFGIGVLELTLPAGPPHHPAG